MTRVISSLLRLVAGLLVAISAATWAATKPAIETIAQKVNQLLETEAVRSVQPAPLNGLYEVVLKSGELIYTNEAVSHFIVGAIIDAKTKENLTEKRLDVINKIDFSSLPLKDAFEVKKGNGQRVIASFEDPNCTFCKRLAKELQGVDNITQYVFLYPILGNDSREKAKRIWCAADPAKAWTEWMLDGKLPPEGRCDLSAIERNVALGQRLGIGGTPTLFLKDGSRIAGFLPAAKLEERLKGAD
jgi:thiol:disulfide interchange protein DsbC